MRLLLSSLTYPLANGVTNSINATVDGLIAAGHQAIIVAPDYDTGKIRPEHVPVSSSRISEVATKQFGNGERFFSLKALGEIQRVVESFNPDVYWLHTVTWAPNIFEVMLQRSKKAKLLTYHTLVDRYAKIYAGALGEQHMVGRSKDVASIMTGVIAPSQFVADRLQNWGVKVPISVVPTGIAKTESGYNSAALKKKYDIPHKNKVLLTVGRVVRDKNISALLRSLQQITQRRTDVTLLLVGPGNLDDFKKEARSLGVEQAVVMTDQVSPDEARKMYWGADVFVFASQSETQGLVFGEAMNAGLPIAALDSMIRAEFYPEGVALVARDESQLASHVLELLDDATKRTELINAGRLFFDEKLSLAAMTRGQLNFIEQLIGGQ